MSEIPLIGLGTWKLCGEECIKTIRLALDLGYRHIDTGDVYQNHQAIGKAIKFWPRQKIYLVTKIAIHDLLPNKVNLAVPRFLKELGTDYIVFPVIYLYLKIEV